MKTSFLTVNNLEAKEALPLRLPESIVTCGRCAISAKVSMIGAVLEYFVCDYCRKDNSVVEAVISKSEWKESSEEGDVK